MTDQIESTQLIQGLRGDFQFSVSAFENVNLAEDIAYPVSGDQISKARGNR